MELVQNLEQQLERFCDLEPIIFLTKKSVFPESDARFDLAKKRRELFGKTK